MLQLKWDAAAKTIFFPVKATGLFPPGRRKMTGLSSINRPGALVNGKICAF
jgi:hypothetical protein